MWGSHINEICSKISVWYCYNCNTIYAFELFILQSAFLSQSTFYPGLQPRVFVNRLTIFSLISSKVEVKSKHLSTLLNYIGHQRVFDCTVIIIAIS